MLKVHTNLTESIRQHAAPFTNTDDLEPLIKRAADAQYVLLGEASHGTSEFYSIRAEITKRLIEDHGFSFVAVEGDWPSCFEVNRYIKGNAPEITSSRDAVKAFNRWPTWMWANEEILPLIDWLFSFNEKQAAQEKKVGFYGMDVYSLWESMEAIISYLEKIDSPDVEKAKNAFDCFEPYHRQAEKYAISSAFYEEDCLQQISDIFHTIQKNRKTYGNDPESSLNMQVNSLVARNAESYYHTMVTNDSESWNIRDRHMVESLDYIKSYYGKEAKGIIWEHNTHIGDARATSMAREGMVNVGQLAREKYGSGNVYAVGFGTYQGSVIAADRWGETYQKMKVPAARSDSWEAILHHSGANNKYLMFTEENRDLFQETIGHRAIGVVYHPEAEQYGNYVPSRMSDRYDAFIHVDETSALKPLSL
ncbi:erythromycin esterase family protein [Bacillus sp. m3-13]|uniref:erythromycin esterase family protein n=1 Tax=Bacillus sp. m3-13 TaxID=406124 RepID=UPI0001E88FB4|nr:erythromycin esterase family protein [Bacillus sp. m3-13]